LQYSAAFVILQFIVSLQTLCVHDLHNIIQDKAEFVKPHADSHWRKEVLLRLVWPTICTQNKPGSAPQMAQWGKAISV